MNIARRFLKRLNNNNLDHKKPEDKVKKAYSLTKHQERRLEYYREKWKKIGLSTEPLTYKEAKHIIDNFYIHVLKKSPPMLILTDNPVSAWQTTLICQALFGKNERGRTLWNMIKDQLISSKVAYKGIEQGWFINVRKLMDEKVIDDIVNRVSIPCDRLTSPQMVHIFNHLQDNLPSKCYLIWNSRLKNILEKVDEVITKDFIDRDYPNKLELADSYTSSKIFMDLFNFKLSLGKIADSSCITEDIKCAKEVRSLSDQVYQTNHLIITEVRRIIEPLFQKNVLIPKFFKIFNEKMNSLLMEKFFLVKDINQNSENKPEGLNNIQKEALEPFIYIGAELENLVEQFVDQMGGITPLKKDSGEIVEKITQANSVVQHLQDSIERLLYSYLMENDITSKLLTKKNKASQLWDSLSNLGSKNIKKLKENDPNEQINRSILENFVKNTSTHLYVPIFREVFRSILCKLLPLVVDQTRNFITPDTCGQFDVGYFSFYDFLFTEVMKPPKNWKYYRDLSKLSLIYPLQDVCVICQKPTYIGMKNGQIHNDIGPAISFKGFDVWAIDGIRVPKWLVEIPSNKLDLNEVLFLDNAEQRIIGIKKIGIEKLKERGIMIDKHGDYELIDMRHIVNVLRYTPYLFMKNPSTNSIHAEGIDPSITKVIDAISWRNGTKELPIILT